MWYQLFKYVVFVPYVRLACRPTVVGREKLPREGGAILAMNHLDAGDTFLVPAMLPRQMVFPAKAELFRGDRGLRSRLVAAFLRAVGQVPLDRSGGRASAEALVPVTEAVQRGLLIGIFPEGTRSPDGRLYKGHTGVARMALATGAPVVPVGLVDTHLRRGPLGIPVMRGARIVLGEPLTFDRTDSEVVDQARLRQVTDRVMTSIQQLTGQQYVDVYGSRAKHGDLKGADLSAHLLDHPGGQPLYAPAEGTDLA